MPENHPPIIGYFGPFQLDLVSGELRKHGLKLKLGEQPFQILKLLLERRGQLVTREELQKQLWPSDTFVDFDHGLNSAIRRLREVLSDTQEEPRWVETVPRRGYRFVGEVTLRLQPSEFQPPKAQAEIIANPAELVNSDTRQESDRTELTARKWSGAREWPDTFVDFEHNLDSSVNKIEKALGGSAEKLRFVEKLARHGYRSNGDVHQDLPSQSAIESPGERSPGILPSTRPKSAARTATWVGVTAVSLLLAGLASVHWRSRPEPPSFSAAPFTSFPGMEYAPTFSPDGSLIAFAWDGGHGDESGGGLDLYVKAIGSETVLRLTNHPSEWISAAWSPDGTQIALHRMAGADTGLYVVPALGGPERKIRATHVPYNVAAPISWSRDSKFLAYSDTIGGKPGDRIFVLSMDTLESRQIPHDPDCNHEADPIFQHSENKLAYVCVHNTKTFAINFLSSQQPDEKPRFVTSFTEFGSGLAWSSDDKRIIVSQNGSFDELDLASKAVTKIPLEQNGSWPAVSPLGHRLAFSTESDHIAIHRKDLSKPDRAIVGLIPSTRAQNWAEYSPDGKHVAFDSARTGVWNVWLMDTDGGSSPVQIPFAKPSGSPRWSPDSQKLAFDTDDAGHHAIYIADVAERVPRKLISNVADMDLPYWSHDGKWIYFRSYETVGHKIYRCPANGGNATLLASGPDPISPQESVDGKALYFMERNLNAGLRRIPLDGSPTESTLEGMPAVSIMTLWTVTRDGIYFVPAASPKTLAFYDFGSRQVHEIFKIKKDFDDGLSVSRDVTTSCFRSLTRKTPTLCWSTISFSVPRQFPITDSKLIQRSAGNFNLLASDDQAGSGANGTMRFVSGTERWA